MKIIVTLLALVALSSNVAFAAGGGFKNEKFVKVFYLEAGGKGAESGLGAANAKDFVSSDLMDIPAGMIIEKAYVIVDTALVGAAVVEVGDDDDADGFVVNASLTLGTPGIYGYASGPSGAYIEHQGLIGADVYVAPAAKYYSAAGKEVKLAVSGTPSAGKARIVIEGYKAAL